MNCQTIALKAFTFSHFGTRASQAESYKTCIYHTINNLNILNKVLEREKEERNNKDKNYITSLNNQMKVGT